MSATHQGTCPICHRVQKIVRGTMAKHGFKRPNGWHAETAGCWGSGRAPWETPEGKAAAEEYVETVLNKAIASRQAFVHRIQSGEEKTLYFQTRAGASVTVTAEGVEVTRNWTTPPETHAAMAKAAVESWTRDLQYKEYTAEWQAMTTWARACAIKIEATRQEAGRIETEAKFLMHQIEAWQPGVLAAVSPATAPLPFEVKAGEVVVVRTATRGFYGQTRYEVWNGKYWARAAYAAIKPLLDAGKARWLATGEKLVASA